MTEHGILLGESLVAPFIQVGIWEKGRLQGRRNGWLLGCLISKRDVTVLHVDTLPWLTLIQDLIRTFLPLFCLTRTDDHLCPPVPRLTLFPHHYRHPQCLRLLGSLVLFLHCHCDLPLHQGVEGKTAEQDGHEEILCVVINCQRDVKTRS